MSNSRALAPHLARLDLDLIEKFLVATFMIVLAARLVPVVLATGALPPILLLMSEGVVVLFILLRRPTQDISRRGGDWLLGLAGTLLPLLAIPPAGSALLPWHVAEAIMLTGFVLQLSAKLTLRRSFGVVAANRGVKASGPYRLVRHPMYAGYALTHVGFLLAGPNAVEPRHLRYRPSPSRFGGSSPRSACWSGSGLSVAYGPESAFACCPSSSEARRS